MADSTTSPCQTYRLAKEARHLLQSLRLAMRALESTLSNYHGISGLDDDCEDDEVVYETIAGRLTERDRLATDLAAERERARRVEALADRWEGYATEGDGVARAAAHDLRAALAGEGTT